MSLKIIGAGFPRTGTMTLKKALETIGYDQTYHYKDLIANSSKLKYWKELEKTGQTDFETLFEGFQATVDFPGYPYYKILLERYPEAKVILTTRDFEKWYDSTYKTIWKSAHKPLSARIDLFKRKILNSKLRNIFRCVKFMRRVFLRNQFDNKFSNKEYTKAIFFQHINDVVTHVPKHQLLIYNVAEGWEPLCDFLNVPIPNEPFPHLNKKENFHKMVKEMISEASKETS